jgi:hypothetical protein
VCLSCFSYPVFCRSAEDGFRRILKLIVDAGDLVTIPREEGTGTGGAMTRLAMD